MCYNSKIYYDIFISKNITNNKFIKMNKYPEYKYKRLRDDYITDQYHIEYNINKNNIVHKIISGICKIFKNTNIKCSRCKKYKTNKLNNICKNCHKCAYCKKYKRRKALIYFL
ncbi:hypothetical protein MYSEV_172 [Mythimna separata entomopoxvirus 'L']|uniref:Uncharacterized protein n=1 Tax=Mythimna separata entomopoxvirus 'L' TaxID=1293572 RepID=A0A916KQG9_9POXV|nr:hypothetical protein MYSEV_172 [Mythimna separata entomopoxvirus 'L']CCU56370.1 hypothetical protein MYSEV_172 [Mythimna separata entomopoxvirus 'L']